MDARQWKLEALSRIRMFSGRLVAGLLWGAVVTNAHALDATRRLSQYGHTAWRLQEGVFDSTPIAISQSKDGYLWLGTQLGLMRFDGVRFTHWAPPAGSSLPDSIIPVLQAGTDGSMWIGTLRGLARLKDGVITKFMTSPSPVSSIVEDKDGSIWFTRTNVSDGKGALCHVVDESSTCHGATDDAPIDYAIALAQDREGFLWIGGDVLSRWKAGKSTKYFASELKGGEGFAAVRSVAVAPDQSVWVGLQDAGKGKGLQHLVDGVWNSEVGRGLDGSILHVETLFFDSNKSLWIGTQDQGIYRVRDGLVDHFESKDGLSADFVRSFYEDSEGDVWVLTTGGVDRFRDLRVATFSTSEGLSKDAVGTVLARKDNSIWIGNEGAIDVLRGNEITSIKAEEGLPGRAVTSMLEDHNGLLWVGLDHKFFTYSEGKFNEIKRDETALPGVVLGLQQTPDHTIWTTIVAQESVLARVVDRRVVVDGGMTDTIFDMASDPAGGLVVSFAKGPFNGDLARYRAGKLEPIRISSGSKPDYIRNILVGDDGSIWGSLYHSGLFYWKEGVLKALDARNGLPCNRVLALFKDSNQSLWVYLTCGLVQIKKEAVDRWQSAPQGPIELRIFDSLDGVNASWTPYTPSAAQSPDGKLWFANGRVLQMLDPSHLYENGRKPPVQVERVVADRVAYDPATTLHFPALTRDIEIDYTALSLSVPERVRFRYQLVGRDTDWQDAGARRQAFYSDLAPGSYAFRVIASNNDGLWNETGATVEFKVQPTFYQTWWFIFACVFSGLFVIYLIYVLRLRQVGARIRAQMDARTEERGRIARDLHDTLLQSTQGLILSFQAEAERLPKIDPARRRMEDALELADKVLIDGRDRLVDLREPELSSLSLSDAFASVEKQFTQGRKERLHVLTEGEPRPIRLEVQDELYRIGREAIVNAYQHAHASLIDVCIAYDDNGLRLQIQDNGRGISSVVLEKGSPPGHLGLSGMRQRARKVGATFRIASCAESGTTIEVKVPSIVAYEGSQSSGRRNWLRRTPR